MADVAIEIQALAPPSLLSKPALLLLPKELCTPAVKLDVAGHVRPCWRPPFSAPESALSVHGRCVLMCHVVSGQGETHSSERNIRSRFWDSRNITHLAHPVFAVSIVWQRPFAAHQGYTEKRPDGRMDEVHCEWAVYSWGYECSHHYEGLQTAWEGLLFLNIFSLKKDYSPTLKK